MRLSLMLYPPEGELLLEGYVDRLRSAADHGFSMVWSPQVPWAADLVALMGAALREVDEIAVGTAVLPIQSRLPMVMAQQALTLSAIGGGRFKLGIGLTHRGVSEGQWGIPWNRPVRRMQEYLDGLLPLLDGHRADVDGDFTSTHGEVRLGRVDPPEVYLAALGPQLLRLAGRRSAGTITWMTGPRTLAGHVVPTIRAAADEAGRTARVIAGVPVCVTDDAGAVRQRVAHRLAAYGDADVRARYGDVSSYRSMLDREGLAAPVDAAIIGDEPHVAARIEEIAATGVDELAASVIAGNAKESSRTLALLSGLREE